MTFYHSLLAFVLLLSSASAQEWTPLFNGNSTEGWTPRGEVVQFEAVNGELVLHAVKHNVWVSTKLEMADFIVELEVKLPDDAAEVGFNSGLAFRCSGAEGKPTGYQCEIDQKAPGGVFGIGLGGWLAKPENADAFRVGEWNTFRVEARGSQVRTFVNGALAVEVMDDQQLAGYFAIQHHGKGGPVKFRNLRVAPVEQPNILWITAEDMSPTLGCYGDAYATTPNLDAFAKTAVRYTNAFATAPVCSPSRSALITGMYAQSMGTHPMRSAQPLPTGVRGFPSFLRDAGYYTTNNVKTDYNTSDEPRVIEESWNESSPTAHWRNEDRQAGQPFFSVFNDMTSHQSRISVWPYEIFAERVRSKLSAEEIHDPAEAPIPAYYPDTPEVRETIARAYDCVTVMDQNVGRILQELEDDGLAEETIVFFYSDHGSGMPRGKRLLHDSGLQVALMVRFPEKYAHLAPADPGSTTPRLVSFVDYAPTVLKLAGLSLPDYLQGEDFLSGERKYLYGSRDRVDEVMEKSRSLRDERWLYIRNYHPHLSWNQPEVFSDLSTIRPDITLYAAQHLGELTAAQLGYAGPTKAPIEFYDTKNDPENVDNLAIKPANELTQEQEVALTRLRRQYETERNLLQDTGALTESHLKEIIATEGQSIRDVLQEEVELGKSAKYSDLDSAWLAADSVGIGGLSDFEEYLDSDDPSVRYWGIVGLRNLTTNPEKVRELVTAHLQDPAPDVRIEAAGFLAGFPETREAALSTLATELGHENWWTALRACRAIELEGENARSLIPVMRALYTRTRNPEGMGTLDNLGGSLFLAFSSGAFLEKLGEVTQPWEFWK